MRQRLLLSIDIGTSRIKIGLFTEDGRRVALESDLNRTISSQPHYFEQDPNVWWRTTVTLIRRLLAKNRTYASQVFAIAITGQMHSPVLIDAHGRAIGRCQTWLDSRAHIETKEVGEKISQSRFLKTTGYHLSPSLTLPKLLWIKKHQPGIYSKTKYVLFPKDYIRSRLTDEFSTDWTDANGSGLFDVRSRSWSYCLFHDLKLDPEKMPAIKAPFEIAGETTERTSRTVGLRGGIPVVTGSGDDVVQLGTGAKRNELAVNLGTSCTTYFASPRPVYDPKMRLECFVGFNKKSWLLSGTTTSAGASLNWILNAAGLLSEDEEPNYSRLNLHSRLLYPSGLVFLPYLSGERTPIWDPTATATLLGLTLRHTRNDLIKGVMEGTCFAIRSIVEFTESLTDRVSLIRIAGGATSSHYWMQTLASILNRRIGVPREREATLMGGAMLAAVGSGLIKTVEKTLDYQPVMTYYVPGKISKAYQRWFEAFLKLSDSYLRR